MLVNYKRRKRRRWNNY